jgi:hypothetical protein
MVELGARAIDFQKRVFLLVGRGLRSDDRPHGEVRPRYAIRASRSHGPCLSLLIFW